MTVRVFATDLDGTLLRSDRTVSPRSARAMAAAQDAGIVVVWATARARHSVHEFAARSGFRGLAVCANGAVIIDLADGTPVVTATTGIDPATAHSTVMRIRERVPGVVFAAVGPTTFVAEAGYAALSQFADHHRDPAAMVLADPADLVPALAEATVKIVARHPTVTADDLYSELASRPCDLELTHSGAPYVEMSAAGVSKASALASLCAGWGIDRSEVAAAGDARNDLAMLEWAGTAVCPAAAIPEVLAVADRVLPGNDDDGIAQYLEEITQHRSERG